LRPRAAVSSEVIVGFIRRVILILVAIAMVVGGGYVLILQVTASTVMYRFIVSGVLVLTFGVYLLWDEFLR
jgi:hypothetical protein